MTDISFRGDLVPIAPMLIVSAFSVIALAVALLRDQERHSLSFTLSLGGLSLAFLSVLVLFNLMIDSEPFQHTIAVNQQTLILQGLLILAGLFSTLLSDGFLKRSGFHQPEFFALLLASLTGMMLLVAARDLIVLFVALELLSIPLYLLAG